MPAMKIILEGDNALPEYAKHAEEGRIIRGEISALTALPAGMTSGLPSIGIWIELDDGRVVFGETSMRLFQTASAAFKGRYGDVT